MPEDILVSVSPAETRIAILEDGQLQEVYFERDSGRGTIGNIYMGKVVRILPGIQAAFIDIGLDRNGILRLPGTDSKDSSSGSKAPGAGLHEGQKVLVQVTHEPQGDKGPRLSRELSLSSRYLVLIPGSQHLGVSQQIRNRAERQRLQQLLEDPAVTGYGVVFRTAAKGVDEQLITDDLRYLQEQWHSLQLCAKNTRKPAKLYSEPPLFYRLLRDRATAVLQRVVIDDADEYAAALAFCQRSLPALASRLEHYTEVMPLFEAATVDAEIQQALGSRVTLGSGAYLVIDQTEAMTTIDVNSGSFVGKSSQESTACQINLEAVPVVARQLRLRNLGGIVVVDFIDMQEPSHRRQLEDAVEQALQPDAAVRSVAGLSALCLVEIGRKRSGLSLQQALCEPCPTCAGTGVLKSAQTVCYEILRALTTIGDAPQLLVLASPLVVDRLRSEDADHIARLQARLEKSISLQADSARSPEHFDIIRLQAS